MLSISSVNAEVYRWTDADGQVHYSQIKPNEKPDAESLKIKTQYKPTDAKVTKAKADVEKTKAAQAKQQEEDLSQLSREQLIQRNCEKARSYKASLQHQGDIAATGEDGKLKTLSEQERKTKLEQAENLVEQYCTDATPAQD